MALVELLTDLSNFKYTDYDNVGANNSQVEGRHGGFEGGGEPPHSEEHSKFDDGVGGIGNPQSFTVRGYTVSDVISGRHGGIEGPTPAQPPHPDDHSIHDDGVGFGVAPSDNPQTFDVRGYTVTGNKRFYIGWQGDIMNHSLSDYGIGAFDSIAGVFDHTQTRDRLRKAYSNYPEITFGADIDGGINGLNGSIHIGNQDLPEVIGGGVSYYGNLNPINPRGSVFRDSSGNYQVPQEGRNTNPPGGISNIPLFEGTKPESGFDRSLMYIPNIIEPSDSVFKEFSRSDSSLIRIDRYSDNFDMNNSQFFEFPDTRPYDLIFKGVTPWAPMWVSDPVTGAKSNIDVTLDSTQPYIVRRIGDRWGLYEGDPQDGGEHLSGAIEWANALSGQFLRAPLDVMVDRSVADIGRIAKFLTSTKGALFLTNQFILQAFSPTIETKVYNPLSLGSIVPMVHVNRHAGGKRYTDVVPSDKAIEAVGDLMPDVSVGPVTIGGNDIINAAFNASGVEQPSFGRVEMQSPLATVSGQKLPLDKRVALSNPNRYLWPGPMGVFVKTGTDAAIADASRIESSQGRVLKRAKEQSGGGVPDLFQKHSFNKYSGENVYLDGKGILFVPASTSPFGTLASIPISVSQATTMATDALTNWGNSLIGGENTKKSDFTPPSRGVDLESPLQKVVGEDVFSATDVAVNRDKEVFGGDHWGPDRPGGIYEQFAFDAVGDRKSVQIGAIHDSVITVKTHSNNQPGESIQPIGGVIVIPQYSLTKDKAKPFQTPILITDTFTGNSYSFEEGKRYTDGYDETSDKKYGGTLAISGKDIHFVRRNYGNYVAKQKNFYSISSDPLTSNQIAIYTLDGQKNLDTARGGNIGSRGDRIFNTEFDGDLYKKGAEYDKDYVYTGTVSDSHISIMRMPTDGSFNHGIKATRTVAYKNLGAKDDTEPGAKKTYTVNLEKLPVPIKIAGVFQGNRYGDTDTSGTNWTDFGVQYWSGHGSPTVPTYPLKGKERALGHASTPKAKQDVIFIHKGSTLSPAATGVWGSTIGTVGTPKPISTKFDHERTTGDGVTTSGPVTQPDGKNIYKKGTLYLSGHGTSILPITPIKAPAGVSISKKVGDYTYSKLTTLYEEDINPKPTSLKDNTFPNFSGDLYHKDNKYTKNISIDEVQSSPLTKTRLRIDDDKDPVVQIQTAHLNTARFNVDGKTTLSSPIKLQNFPLFNNQSGGNLGSEKQALGFINESGTPIQLADSLYGHQWNADKRGGLTFKDGYEKSIKSVPKTDKEKLRGIVDKGRFGLSDKNIPQVIKKLSTKNINKDGNVTITDGGDNEVESQIVQNIHERKSETNKSGNLLDRYKTLAYGDIPTKSDESEKYSKKTGKAAENDKGGQYTGQEKDEVTLPNKLYEIPAEDKLGLVKKNTDGEYMYGHGTGIGEPDSINMTPYGDDSDPLKPDYIKFKFFDIVNNKHIIFRAFLSGISETLSPEWASERYIGRPDSVHVYQGVDRSMSFEFMVVPSSKQELPILWEKLNYLVGFTYPTWKTVGNGKRMEAPFMNLTIGDMYNAVPGFLSSLSITVDDNSPWEIEEGFQLPHAINVSCEFTHIGKHPLASIGKHYDLGWLKQYNRGADWKQKDNPQLVKRGDGQLPDLMGI